MTPDAFRGFGWGLVFIAFVIFLSGWGGGVACNFLCKKYTLKIEAKP